MLLEMQKQLSSKLVPVDFILRYGSLLISKSQVSVGLFLPVVGVVAVTVSGPIVDFVAAAADFRCCYYCWGLVATTLSSGKASVHGILTQCGTVHIIVGVHVIHPVVNELASVQVDVLVLMGLPIVNEVTTVTVVEKVPLPSNLVMLVYW